MTEPRCRACLAGWHTTCSGHTDNIAARPQPCQCTDCAKETR